MFFIILALLLASFASSAIASVLRGELFGNLFPGQVISTFWAIISIIISIASAILLYLIAYWLMPNVKLTFKNIWLGTLVAGSAWEAAKYVFAIYLGVYALEGYGLAYGSLATVIFFMFWIYISAVLLLIGAEINIAFEQRR